jgi:hypothetical protein
MQTVPGFRLILLLLILFVSGCSSNTASSNKGKIEGTKWRSEPVTLNGEDLPAGALQMEFQSDGGLVYQNGLQKVTGTYTLGAGDTVIFQLDEELGGRKKHKEKITITGDKLTLTDSNGVSVTFDKAN